MKKIIMIVTVAVAGVGFVGCGADDNTKADVQWTNSDTNLVETIQWVSNGHADQTWDGTWNPNSTTPPKGISELTGQGECVDSEGKPSTIQLDTSSTGGTSTISNGATSVSIQENVTATLVIQGTTVITK